MMRFSIVLLTVLASAGTAFADELGDKQCIFAAAMRLPPLPGMTIATSRIAAADKGRIAALIAAKAASTQSDAIDTADRFGFLDGKTRQAIEDAFLSGRSEKGASIVKDGVETQMSSGVMVEIDVNAVGQSATFGFACGLTQDGTAYAVPRGLLR